MKSYAAACGCPAHENVKGAVNCLNSTDVKTLQNNSIAWEGSMTSLGGYVRANIFETIRSGHFPKVPIMVSMCRDEGTVQALGFQPNNTKTTSLVIESKTDPSIIPVHLADLSVFVDLISGRGLKGKKAQRFLSQMLEAYPNDPVLGCPFDGSDTEYGDGSQYKRMAAIATDGIYTEAWTEYLETLSLKTKTWGLYWEQPIHGAPPELGIVHGSDMSYYFPGLLGEKMDPRAFGNGNGDLMASVQKALINFINDGDPNGCNLEDGKDDQDHRPPFALYSESGMVTYMNASRVAVALPPPKRRGFDVIHKYLRSGPL